MRNIVIIIAGVMIALAGMWLLRRGQHVQFAAPPGAGAQEQAHAGTRFRNHDAATDLTQARFASPAILRVGSAPPLSALDRFTIYQVTGGPGQWVFVWEGGGRERALQGIPSPAETQPARALRGRDESVATRVTRSVSSRPMGATVDEEEPAPAAPSYGEQLNDRQWRHTLSFVFMKGEAPLYVALVDHPTDAASEARAAAFVDDAVSRKRTIHHGPAIMALMMSMNRPAPRAWLDWLASAATRDVEELMRESDPPQGEPGEGLLRERAAEMRIEAAVALAVLSDFSQVGPLIKALKVQPDAVALMLVDWCRSRPIKPTDGDGMEEVLALVSALRRAEFEIARLSSDPVRLAAVALDRAEDASLPADARSEYCNAAAQVVFDHQPAGVIRLARAIESVLDAPGAQHRHALAQTLRRIDPARMLDVLLKQSEREPLAYAPAPWAVAQWRLVVKDAQNKEAYVGARLERLMKVVYPDARPRKLTITAELHEILAAYRRGGGEPRNGGDQPRNGGKPVEVLEIEAMAKADPNRAYDYLYGLCQSHERRSLAVLTIILEGGFSPDFTSTGKYPVLHIAVIAGNTEAVKLLLKHGAAVNPKREGVLSPLDRAVSTGNVELVRLLLQSGATLRTASQVNKQGLPPTIVLAASAICSVELATLLIDHGADLTATGLIRDRTVTVAFDEVVPPGTALDLAIETKNQPLIDLFTKRGAKALRAPNP